MEIKFGFASDNTAGVHPLIMDEIRSANNGHTIGYGYDRFTEEAMALSRGTLTFSK